MSEENIKENIEAIQQKIASAAKVSGRCLEDITLVAITKHCDIEMILQAWEYKQRAFGENYVQEAIQKQERLIDLPIEWHFTGRIQTNKAKYLASHFRYIHTVDSIHIAEAIHRRILANNLSQNILIQVNMGNEPQKGGVSEHLLFKFAEAVVSLSKLNLCGLMCIPPISNSGEATRPYFSRLRDLRDKLSLELGLALPVLSMGMSLDYIQAIEEGSTCVRVGTGIFGQRPHN